ncbi:hypothetical protein ES703_50562 [subsurface metagenome]
MIAIQEAAGNTCPAHLFHGQGFFINGKALKVMPDQAYYLIIDHRLDRGNRFF